MRTTEAIIDALLYEMDQFWQTPKTRKALLLKAVREIVENTGARLALVKAVVALPLPCKYAYSEAMEAIEKIKSLNGETK